MNTIAQGAEAKVYISENGVYKIRPLKEYRHPQIDKTLRQFRTRREAKILEKLKELDIPAPHLISLDDKEMKIEMTHIQGPTLAECLENNPLYAKQIGTLIGALHVHDIIHGDPTTSNMIVDNDQVHLIDFGLSFFSSKVEDKAVDLHCLRQALESKHHTIWKECFDTILQTYQQEIGESFDLILQRFEKVEARGRNKNK